MITDRMMMMMMTDVNGNYINTGNHDSGDDGDDR